MPLAMPSSTVSGMMCGANAWNIVGSRCPPVGVVGDRRGRHLDDPLALDEEVARFDELALLHVEHAGADQVDGRLRCPRTGHGALLQVRSLCKSANYILIEGDAVTAVDDLIL